MIDERAALQCQARGCDGCVVCDTENNGGQDALQKYRELERQLNEYWVNRKPGQWDGDL